MYQKLDSLAEAAKVFFFFVFWPMLYMSVVMVSMLLISGLTRLFGFHSHPDASVVLGLVVSYLIVGAVAVSKTEHQKWKMLIWPWLRFGATVKELDRLSPVVGYDVYVGGICMAFLPKSDYSAILRDPRLYAAQAYEVLRLGWSSVMELMRTIPVVVFWSLVAVAFVYSPDAIAKTMVIVLADPTVVKTAVFTMSGPIFTFLVFCLLFLAFPSLMKDPDVLVNAFKEKRNSLIKHHFYITDEGDIDLVPMSTADVLAEDAGWGGTELRGEYPFGNYLHPKDKGDDMEPLSAFDQLKAWKVEEERQIKAMEGKIWGRANFDD